MLNVIILSVMALFSDRDRKEINKIQAISGPNVEILFLNVIRDLGQKHFYPNLTLVGKT
jgi:hypothetical protein